MRTKAVVKRALSPAMRMSQARAMLSPAPAAGPFTMAMVGLGISCSSRDVSSRCRRRVTGLSSDSASPEAMPPMSPPAQKARPAPVTNTQRTSLSSASPSMIGTSASIVSPSRALSFWGRLRVTVATWSEMSTSTVSDVVAMEEPPSRLRRTGLS